MSRRLFIATRRLAEAWGWDVDETREFMEGWLRERPDIIERVGRDWWRLTDAVATRDAPAISLLPEPDPRPRCFK